MFNRKLTLLKAVCTLAVLFTVTSINAFVVTLESKPGTGNWVNYPAHPTGLFLRCGSYYHSFTGNSGQLAIKDGVPSIFDMSADLNHESCTYGEPTVYFLAANTKHNGCWVMLAFNPKSHKIIANDADCHTNPKIKFGNDDVKVYLGDPQ